MEPRDVVAAFFERMQARDWRRAGQLLADDVHVEFTSTGERFDGPAYLAMNEAYPEGWRLEVRETIADGHRVGVQVVVRHGDATFWCAGFYTVERGAIAEGVEHWVTAGAETPPEWRRRFASD